MSSEITLTDLESAINFWRQRHPSQGEEMRLSAQAAALAVPYAGLILNKRRAINLDELELAARQAIEQWQQQNTR
jgi:hypothetical protein